MNDLLGLLETGATLGTGAVSGLLGMPYGLYKGITSGAYGTPLANRIAEEEARKFMERNTYQPRTQAGQENLQTIAGLLERSKLPPVMPEVALLGQIPRQAVAAQAERAGMAAEKAIAPAVTRTMERGGLPAQLLQDLSQGSISPMDVWHGSPHGPFTNFDRTKIGSGEGAQVFGIGHYLAEARPTAEDYRKKLSDWGSPFTYEYQGQTFAPSEERVFDPVRHAIQLTYHQGKKVAQDIAKNGLADAKKGDAYALEMGGVPYYEKMLETAKSINKKDIKATQGFTYKVDLPDEQIAKMVEWEIPLSEMDEKMASVINPLRQQLMNQPNPDLFKNARTVGDVIQYANALKLNPHIPLAEAGYPGIKYLDQMSRGAGKGTRNFVVFPGNEDLLTIKEINDKPVGGLLGQPKAAESAPITSLKDIENKFNDVTLDVYEKNGTINLSRIVVPKDMRSSGIGSNVMNDLTSYADKTGQKMALTPSGEFGGNVKRLKDFYKQFGFVENKGKNKDFSTMETMIRLPETLKEPKELTNLLD